MPFERPVPAPDDRLDDDALGRRRQAVVDAERADDAAVPSGPTDRWGLCFSGGGIRSATYCLGVAQTIARTPVAAASADAGPPVRHADSLFARFDYLSTVSGGGYAGSFIASLFVPGRLVRSTGDGPSPSRPGAPGSAGAPAEAADAALAALVQDPPGRITSGPDALVRQPATFPLAWLRENGRYLSPTGAGDMAYAAALDLRNWIALHYVVGTMLAVVFSLLALLRALLAGYGGIDELPVDGDTLWCSPLLWLALIPLLAWAVPTGIAFWFTYPGRGRPRLINIALLATLGIDVVLVLLFASGLGGPFQARQALLAGGILALSSSFVHHARLWRHRVPQDPIASMRVLTTRSLLHALQWTLALLALGAIETLGQSLYLVALEGGSNLTIGGATGLAGVLTWLARQVLKVVSPDDLPTWVTKLPLTLVGGAMGVLIFALLAVAWNCFVTWIVWDGEWPTPEGLAPGARAVIAIVAVGLAWVTGQFPGFINLSSLQSFYSARLTRAYLGASNGARVVADPKDARLSTAEPVEGDDVLLSHFVSQGAEPKALTLAPFHLINTTLNKTVDPSEQLVQRDRKGQPFVISPVGFAVDGHRNPFHGKADATEIEKTLSVGGWVGISGAAASTGIGRNTSLGLSLLLGAANVRLGSWWESQAPVAPRREKGFLRGAFRTQAYLLEEFTAKFHGMDRPWQYLTDGGHFENTALYELLRPQRRLRLAVAVDAGTDPDYGFADLANLIRLARIDFRIEIEACSEALPGVLAHVFGSPAEMREQTLGIRAGKLAGQAAVVTQCAVLLKVRYPDREDPAWVILVKPRLRSDAPIDVHQYALTHPAFPQESTGDQFFDEAQWESYRKLGATNAQAVFCPAVLTALQTLIEEDLGQA